MKQTEFEKTILAQYANSSRMLQILGRFNNAVDPLMDIDNFYTEVFDLDTCGTYGLDVWGVIVAAPRTIAVDDTDYFGFKDSELFPFDQAPFFNTAPTTHNVELGNRAYRRLIYYKAMVNIMSTTLPNINAALWRLFEGAAGEDDIYVQEHTQGVMTMRIIFRFSLTPLDRAILRTYGYLLRPAGVGLKIYEIPKEVFGFQGSDLHPFDQAPFWSTLINDMRG